MIECLQYSPLAQSLTMAENVSLVHLSKAFSTANYKQSEALITFEVDSHKASISKYRFCWLLGFTATDDLVNPESIPSFVIGEVFYQMGYLESFSLLSKFKKPNLPSTWNGLFTLLFKSFFERVTLSDSASKLFCTLIYDIYKGIKLDYGYVIWAQLVQSTLSSSRHSEKSCARYWSVIVEHAITRL